MTTLILLAQGALSGYVAGLAFGTGIEFWITVLINAMLVVAYGIFVSKEND